MGDAVSSVWKHKGALAGASLGGTAGGPLGAAGGAYLGNKLDVSLNPASSSGLRVGERPGEGRHAGLGIGGALPPGQDLRPPDLTDEVIKSARRAEMDRQRTGRTRQSTFAPANRTLLG